MESTSVSPVVTATIKLKMLARSAVRFAENALHIMLALNVFKRIQPCQIVLALDFSSISKQASVLINVTTTMAKLPSTISRTTNFATTAQKDANLVVLGTTGSSALAALTDTTWTM